jgi:serine/threonine protein kinase
VASSRRTLQPGRRLGPYEVLSTLGIGGMGEVYRARDHRLERDVALKVLSFESSTDPEALARFAREARAVAALSHPGILAIFDVGEDDGIRYAVTELLHGDTLRVVLQDGPLPWRRAAELVCGLADALAAAHDRGIVHRDLKPENLILTAGDRLKVLDFGLARTHRSDAAADELRTTAGQLMGTVGYMSPEQARGDDAGPPSDVFSLGCVLHEMLSGSRPFAQAVAVDEMWATLHAEPAPLAVPAPRDLDGLRRRCLERDPSRRPTAPDLARELRALVAATSSSTPSRTRRAPVVPSAPPETRYARSEDVNIAYQVVGDGPLDIVFVMGWVSHLEWFWKEPSFARFLARLASFGRLILFDKRGTGLSDRVPHEKLPTLEQRMEDVRAVMDAVGAEKAVLVGVSEGGPLCSLFAASWPDRTQALVMIGTYARRLRADDYPWGPTVEQRAAFLDLLQREWGGPVGIEDRAPSRAQDAAFRDWWATYLRMGASPGAAVALTRMNAQIDVRAVLPTIRVPTLVIHRTQDRALLVDEGRYVAEHIPGARFVELPGEDHLPFVGEQDEILDAIEGFLATVDGSGEPDRLLGTLLAVRIEPEGAVPPESVEALRRTVERHRGRLVSVRARGAVAFFDGTVRALRCAMALVDRAPVPAAAGVHTGECDVLGSDIGGAAVEAARDLAGWAPLGGVIASATTHDLVAGSGLEFEEAGEGQLEGRVRRLYRVLEPSARGREPDGPGNRVRA